MRSMGGGGNREEKHFRGVTADQYNSMANSLCCIQFTLFHRPQTIQSAVPFIKGKDSNYVINEGQNKSEQGNEEEGEEESGSRGRK